MGKSIRKMINNKYVNQKNTRKYKMENLNIYIINKIIKKFKKWVNKL